MEHWEKLRKNGRNECSVGLNVLHPLFQYSNIPIIPPSELPFV